VEEDFRMLQHRYPKHPLESTHSTHRSQATDLLPIAMAISDPKETKKKKKKKKVGFKDQNRRQISKSRVLHTHVATREQLRLQSKLLSDTENKTKKAWIRGATTNEDQSRTSHSSP
jgi:hypothetical protein